jgi:hypothetical protein
VFARDAFAGASGEVGVDHVADFAGEMGCDLCAEVGAFGLSERLDGGLLLLGGCCYVLFQGCEFCL